MIVRVDSDSKTLEIRPGMWFKDRNGKRWQWSEHQGLGTLTDGNGAFLNHEGNTILWDFHRVASTIECGDLTPEIDAAIVAAGTLDINTVIKWGKYCWQIVEKTYTGHAPDSVRIRVWPNIRCDAVESAVILRSTHVIPLGVPVVVNEKCSVE